MRRKLIFIYVLILFTILLILYFDSSIVKGVSLIRNTLFDDFFMGITFVSSEIIIFFILTSFFLWKEHKRIWILPLWVTLVFSAGISFILKVIFQRQRPYQLGIVSVMPVLEKASYLVWNFSFPSFQAMLAFCGIPLLSKEFPKLKYIWVIFATLIAFSRVYFGLHFLSDVIFGGLIGYLIGFFILKLEQKSRIGKKIYRKIFKKS